MVDRPLPLGIESGVPKEAVGGPKLARKEPLSTAAFCGGVTVWGEAGQIT